MNFVYYYIGNKTFSKRAIIESGPNFSKRDKKKNLHSLNDFFKSFYNSTDDELISFLFNEKFIHNEMNCSACGIFMKYFRYKNNLDKYAWTCMNKSV